VPPVHYPAPPVRAEPLPLLDTITLSLAWGVLDTLAPVFTGLDKIVQDAARNDLLGQLPPGAYHVTEPPAAEALKGKG